ncbi:MAG: hypothetical protein ACP6IS_11540 [Candidatus Asgardarchaeia archaeon]
MLFSGMFFGFFTPATADTHEETINIPALSYYYYSRELEEGYKLTVDIEVKTSGADITFIIMNSTNYQKWSSGKEAYAYVYKPSVVETTVNWNVPKTDVYYLVLDNTDSFSATSVHIKIVYEKPVNMFGYVLVALVAVAVVIGLIFVYSKSHKSQQSQPSTSQQPTTVSNIV